MPGGFRFLTEFEATSWVKKILEGLCKIDAPADTNLGEGCHQMPLCNQV